MSTPRDERIAANVAATRDRIDQAARRARREPNEVALVAVSKYVGVEEVRALVAAGCFDLGESRPRQLAEKAEATAELPIRWHQIGTLQRNKVRLTLARVHLIQSVDTLKLVEAIDRIAGEMGLRAPILLEVNVSGEEAKHGFSPETLPRLLPRLATFSHVEIRGLMAMATWGGNIDTTGRDFAELRELRDRLASQCPEGLHFDELSMGMSGDYEEAIAHGATIVRIGSALFEGIDR